MRIDSPEITAGVVRANLHGDKPDVSGVAFRLILLACLAVVLVALTALVLSISGEGLDVLSTRGIADFIRRPFSIRPQIAGVYQGIVSWHAHGGIAATSYG